MKVRFFVIKSKTDLTSIHVRFWDSNRIDQKTKTGLIVKFSNWSPTKEQVKSIDITPEKDLINSTVRKIENYLVEQYNTDYINCKFQ